jgi:(2Fe-2S) ferredoxin
VPETPAAPGPDGDVPGLTACALCAGETLGADDPLPGGQLARLRALADRGAARLTEVDCLDACERGDVVVARPSGPARRAGAGPVWFERLSGEADTAALEAWLRAGGPGARPLPAPLPDRVIHRGG